MKCAVESGPFQFCGSANLQPDNSSSFLPIVGDIGLPKSIQGQPRRSDRECAKVPFTASVASSAHSRVRGSGRMRFFELQKCASKAAHQNGAYGYQSKHVQHGRGSAGPDETRWRCRVCVLQFPRTAIARSHDGSAKLWQAPIGLLNVVLFIALALSLTAARRVRAQVPAPARVWMPFSHLGVGATLGTTGIGAEVAVPYGAYWNIRAGVSYLSYSRTFQTSASPVEGHLRLGGARLGVDWFPHAGGFHISLGVMVPNLTQATAHLNLQPGKTLTIEGVDYTTDPANPFRGAGYSEIYRVAPMLTVGWGNLIPRNYHKRFSFPIEIGAAYEGPPTAHVTTSGSICTAGQGCSLAASDPGFNGNLNQAIGDVNSNLDRYARFFPVISAGIGYRF